MLEDDGFYGTFHRSRSGKRFSPFTHRAVVYLLAVTAMAVGNALLRISAHSASMTLASKEPPFNGSSELYVNIGQFPVS